MTNTLGPIQNPNDKSERLSTDGKDQVSQNSGKPNSPLSLSDLMAVRTNGKDVRQANLKEFHKIVSKDNTEPTIEKVKFDPRKTSDISKLLYDKTLKRNPKAELLKGPEKDKGPYAVRDFKWTSTREVNASSNMGLFHPIGLRQHFNLRGVDVTALEKEGKDYLPLKLVDDFLKNTLIDDSRLTSHAQKDLEETTFNLAGALTNEEIIANSIHLARLLRHLQYIEESKKAVMLAMGVDPDNKLANQLFKELERVHPADIAYSPVKTTRPQLNKSDLAKRIIDLSKGRITIVGDLLIDELLEGKPERISREAPVLILEHVDTALIPGGAANTAHNITALGGTCHAIGVCGDDEYQSKLKTMLENHGISHDLVIDPSRPTTVKTRILSKSHSLMQQLLRLDRISHETISEEIEKKLAEKISSTVSNYNAVILSDYRAGAITDSVIKACREATRGTKTMLVVDAQNGFDRFNDCSLITPNQPDTEAWLGFKIDSQEKLVLAGKKMLETSGAESILITRGSEGMALFQKGQEQLELPVFNKSEVFDVTGAGDTVVATMALALVTGASPLEAMALGNLAAGIVVKKSGTAVTSQKEMLDILENLEI